MENIDKLSYRSKVNKIVLDVLSKCGRNSTVKYLDKYTVISVNSLDIVYDYVNYLHSRVCVNYFNDDVTLYNAYVKLSDLKW